MSLCIWQQLGTSTYLFKTTFYSQVIILAAVWQGPFFVTAQIMIEHYIISFKSSNNMISELITRQRYLNFLNTFFKYQFTVYIFWVQQNFNLKAEMLWISTAFAPHGTYSLAFWKQITIIWGNMSSPGCESTSLNFI